MVISVSSIVAVVSIVSGLGQMVEDQLDFLSPDTFVVARAAMIMSQKDWIEAMKRPNITVNDYARIRNAELPSVAAVGARDATNRIAYYGAKKYEGATINGVTANYNAITNIYLDDGFGRWFTEAEEHAAKYVAVIGASIKEEFFGLQDPIGRTILVAGLPFRVIGTLKKEGESFMGDNSNDSNIFIPFSVYKRNFTRSWSDIVILGKAKSVDLLDEAQDEVRAYLRAMRHTPFRAPDPFQIVTKDYAMDTFNQMTAAIFSFFILITGVSLFVGGIVVMNIMLVSVAERTQEIGIRRAIGARRRDIMRQFLLEATLMSVAGGLLGFVIGAGLALSIKGMTGFPAQVTWTIVCMAIGVSAAVGLLAGFVPARRAAGLQVIDALRAE
jgi:putative ABC transport system permease protein